MNITIIGAGNVGSALARGLTAAGHRVTTVGNDPARIADLAASSEAIFLAVPYAALGDVARTIGAAADGKIVVDITNALNPDFTLALGYSTSGTEELAAKLPRARIVKAFNTVFAGTMADGKVDGHPLTAFVAADDAEAKATVMNLAGAIGFDPVDAGPLANARLLEPLGYLNIQLGYVLGMGTQIGMKLIH